MQVSLGLLATLGWPRSEGFDCCCPEAHQAYGLICRGRHSAWILSWMCKDWKVVILFCPINILCHELYLAMPLRE